MAIKTYTFKNYSKQATLVCATNSSREIYDIAYKLMFELWDKEIPLRLIGVSASNIVKNQVFQQSMFEQVPQNMPKKNDASLYKATDMIRQKFGSDALVRASFMNKIKKENKEDE